MRAPATSEMRPLGVKTHQNRIVVFFVALRRSMKRSTPICRVNEAHSSYKVRMRPQRNLMHLGLVYKTVKDAIIGLGER